MIISRFFIIIFLGMVLQGIFISLEHREKYVAADVFKGLASAIFVLIGYCAAAAYPDDTFVQRICLGLLFGLVGDVVMNLRFVFKESAGQKAFLGGILAFLIGHIAYLVALVPYSVHLVAVVIIGAAVAALLLAYIFKTMDVKKAFKIFGVFYLGAVIFMTVMAVDIAVFAGSRRAILYAIGAVLFMSSDIVLIFNTFSGKTRFPLRVTNLSLYYIGQILIAVSLIFAY